MKNKKNDDTAVNFVEVPLSHSFKNTTKTFQTGFLTRLLKYYRNLKKHIRHFLKTKVIGRLINIVKIDGLARFSP